MKLLIQRVKKAKVWVSNKVVGKIDKGFLVFLGIHKEDTEKHIPYLVNKLVNLRIFPNQEGKFDQTIEDVQGQVLVVSQFTLYGNCEKGRRPDFLEAMKGEGAKKLYQLFVDEIEKRLGFVQTGIFAAEMDVELINDGPVTLMIEKT